MSDDLIDFSAAHHPGKHRARVSLSLLFFGLFAGPIVWAGNLMFTYALNVHACFPGHQPLARAIGGFGFSWSLIVAGYIIAMAVCVAAFAAAFRCWRVTGRESDGHLHHLVDVGEGRTRFLGIIGMAFSVLFFCAALFGIIPIAIEPLCSV
jgi:uncharacterized membrane protein YeiB